MTVRDEYSPEIPFLNRGLNGMRVPFVNSWKIDLFVDLCSLTFMQLNTPGHGSTVHASAKLCFPLGMPTCDESYLSGWWFGTWNLFSIIIGNFIIPTDELTPSFFKGVGFNHQPAMYAVPWVNTKFWGGQYYLVVREQREHVFQWETSLSRRIHQEFPNHMIDKFNIPSGYLT